MQRICYKPTGLNQSKLQQLVDPSIVVMSYWLTGYVCLEVDDLVDLDALDANMEMCGYLRTRAAPDPRWLCSARKEIHGWGRDVVIADLTDDIVERYGSTNLARRAWVPSTFGRLVLLGVNFSDLITADFTLTLWDEKVNAALGTPVVISPPVPPDDRKFKILCVQDWFDMLKSGDEDADKTVTLIPGAELLYPAGQGLQLGFRISTPLLGWTPVGLQIWIEVVD